jgi:hypothetical protein
MPGRPARHTRPTAALVPALALALALAGGSGCRADPAEDDAPAATAPGSASPSESAAPPAGPAADPAVRTRTRTGSVTGRIPKAQRKVVVHRVSGVVDEWLEAAYVGGTYPRTTFRRSWPGFTTGATRTARGDRDLMSNADLGDRIDGVTVKRREITVDLLAVAGTARAATARVHLTFTTSGTARKVTVTGRLFLTRKAGRWRVFGYDVAKARA